MHVLKQYAIVSIGLSVLFFKFFVVGGLIVSRDLDTPQVLCHSDNGSNDIK